MSENLNRPLEPGCVYIGQMDLQLKRRTAAKYLTLRRNVFNRTKRWITITYAYGAKRSNADQQFLVNGWNKRLPGFYYAAPVGKSNHQPGEAFDIYNWAWVGEAVIKEEAAKLGLRRDPSERWHWNDDGSEPSAIDWSLLEDNMGLEPREHVMLTRLNDFWTQGEPGMHEDGLGYRLVRDGSRAAGDARDISAGIRDKIAELEKAGAFLNTRMEHIFPDSAGKPRYTTAFDVIRYEPKEHQNTRDEIAGIKEYIEAMAAPALTSEQILELAKHIQPIDEEAIIEKVTKAVLQGIRDIFLDAGTPDKK
ncbi:endolysin [Clavibacter phage CMP1]|uniref:Endolysin n=1 Tax=Clavibacter phage CMP1 TaxID=686439 RepID=D0U220_9CAUD|nr:endolysin [Clavibacter phage CMP1]ACY35932.1 endolysin [Clavibacter phage CMP1]